MTVTPGFKDGRGRWMDNVFIERLWRSLKYECVFMNAFETGSEARTGIGRWIGYYNADRPHSVFGGRTPHEVYAMQASFVRLPHCPLSVPRLPFSSASFLQT